MASPGSRWAFPVSRRAALLLWALVLWTPVDAVLHAGNRSACPADHTSLSPAQQKAVCQCHFPVREKCPPLEYRGLHGDCCKCSVLTEESGLLVARILALLVAFALSHAFIRAGAHDEENDLDHIRAVKTSREHYARFGLTMSIEDYADNAYDMLDLQYLRLTRLVLFVQVVWAASPTLKGNSNWESISAGPCRSFSPGGPEAASMAVCWLGRPESKQWEMILWTVFAVTFIAVQVVADAWHRRVRRVCCRGPSALPEAPRKTCVEKLQRWRKVAAMTYCMLYPLLLKVLVEGLPCTEDGALNFLDMATPCPVSHAVSIGLIVAWTLPAVVMSLVVVWHYQRDHLNDEQFLHSWGFLVIGYKPGRIFWPLLDWLELCLYLALYASSANFIEPSIRLSLNWIVCAIKLFLQSWLEPYESKTIDASMRQNYVLLLALFFVASTSAHREVEQCNQTYSTVLTVLYRVTLWLFLLGSVLFHTFDFCFHGAVSTAAFQKFRRCVRAAGDDLEEDAPAIDVVEDYRIPSEDLTVRIQERLGSGGAGSVYKADWTQDSKPVAAKELIETLMDAQQTMEFEREVKNLIQANHRAVINFYGICDKYDARLEQNRRYIVMEYAENGSLEGTLEIMSQSYSAQVERLAGGARMARTLQMVYPLSVGQILTWALDIASALKYLNSRGMPHRDVKPQNIFLDANNRAKVGDLGFAKLHSTVAAMRQGRPSAGASSARIQRQKSSAEAPPSEDQFGGGTPEYMAPEAFHLPPSQWGEKVDVWAYGVTLKRIVTLAQPFEAAARRNFRVDVPAGRVRPFAHVPAARIHYAHPALETLLDACLNFHPAERPTFGIIFDVLKKMRDPQSAKVTTARRTEVFNPLLMGEYHAPAAVVRPRLSVTANKELVQSVSDRSVLGRSSHGGEDSDARQRSASNEVGSRRKPSDIELSRTR